MLFTTYADLAQVIERASHFGFLRKLLCCSMLPSPLLIDEVGDITRPSEQACNFFELVMACSEYGSIMLTSTTNVTPWGPLLGGKVLATALLDAVLA